MLLFNYQIFILISIKKSNLDFETKFAQIRYELTEMHAFQN